MSGCQACKKAAPHLCFDCAVFRAQSRSQRAAKPKRVEKPPSDHMQRNETFYTWIQRMRREREAS